MCIQASFSGSSTSDHDGGYASPEVKVIDHMQQIDWRPGTRWTCLNGNFNLLYFDYNLTSISAVQISKQYCKSSVNKIYIKFNSVCVLLEF